RELAGDRLAVEIAPGVEAPVCSLSHLRRMKRASDRPRDAVDLAELTSCTEPIRASDHASAETLPTLRAMNVVAEGQAIDEATEPARWLLASGEGGIGLTQTGALARSVVRDAAERWPSWWNAELFGPPHREADVAVLQALHEGLRRVRLLRRRGRQLM